MISVAATSDGAIVFVRRSDEPKRLESALDRAFPTDWKVEVVESAEPRADSSIWGGDGMEWLEGAYCSGAFSGYRWSASAGSYSWYEVTAGHCHSECGTNIGTQHHPATHGSGTSIHDNFAWSSLPVKGAHPGSSSPSDQSVVLLGTSGSASSPVSHVSRYVRSPTGAFGVRPIYSIGDASTFLGTTGVTFESYGHTTGDDTSVYIGISPEETMVCPGVGSYGIQWAVLTNTGDPNCGSGGNSGGPLSGIYYPGTAGAYVSVLGTLGGHHNTAFGQVCVWSQPAAALSAWGVTPYTPYP